MLNVFLLCMAALAIDGDTFECRDTNGQLHSIRVLALHAPERNEPGGPEATAALRAVLARQWIACLPEAHSFSRLVATCTFPDGRDLATTMIESGKARHCPSFGRPELEGLPDNGLPLPVYCKD